MQIQTSDLLPPLYDRIVENFTRIKLTQAQRSAILITLITSLRQSAMAYSKDYTGASSREKSFDLSLLTSDRFTSRWLSRDELLERISKGASLDRHLTSIGLLLIEARVDISLEATKTLFVEGLGSITEASADEKCASNSAFSSEINDRAGWAREALRAVRHELGPQSLWLHWFKRTSWRLTELGDNLEMSATFRAPLAYNILLSSNAESSQPRLKISWGTPPVKGGVVRKYLKEIVPKK